MLHSALTCAYKRLTLLGLALAMLAAAAVATPAMAADAIAGQRGLVAQSGLTAFSCESALPALRFLAIGGRAEEAGGERQPAAGAGWSEAALGGSFLGALLFGYPYQGLGAADMVLLVLGGLALLNIFVLRGRRGNRQGDRFSVGRRGSDLAGQRRNDAGAGPPGRNEPDREGQEPGPDKSAEAPWWREPALRQQPPPEPPQSGDRQAGRARPITVKDRAAAAWAYYSSTPGDQQAEAPLIAEGARVPKGFDVADFLEGARTLYVRLQKAWAARSLDELAPFVTPSMLALLKAQVGKDPQPVDVDIMLVNATLQDVEQRAELEEARVLFNVLMRSGSSTQPGEVDEVWSFVRGEQTDDMWRLSGIEAA